MAWLRVSWEIFQKKNPLWSGKQTDLMSFPLLLLLSDLIVTKEESSGLILNIKIRAEELMSKVASYINVIETWKAMLQQWTPQAETCTWQEDAVSEKQDLIRQSNCNSRWTLSTEFLNVKADLCQVLELNASITRLWLSAITCLCSLDTLTIKCKFSVKTSNILHLGQRERNSKRLTLNTLNNNKKELSSSRCLWFFLILNTKLFQIRSHASSFSEATTQPIKATS